MPSDGDTPPISIPIRQIEWPPAASAIYSGADDEQLLNLIKSGDPIQQDRAWTTLYSRYRLRVWKRIIAKVPHQENAQDIYLCVWIVAVEKLPAEFIWQGKPIIAWLNGVAQNQIRKRIAAEERERKMQRLVWGDLQPLEAQAADPALEDYGEVLTEAVARLKNSEHRQIILLRYLKRLSIKEIAKKLNKKANTVTQAHKRALKKLLPILRSMAAEDGEDRNER
ncbi:MAG TPA: sigma-70 family RNA polymerase sigma factor [Chloroflexi bacterium]|nr:sigma-70 family RNA polymerase sigma factor [Chloroflexota bacterium]